MTLNCPFSWQTALRTACWWTGSNSSMKSTCWCAMNQSSSTCKCVLVCGEALTLLWEALAQPSQNCASRGESDTASLPGKGREAGQADKCIQTHSELTRCKSPEPLQDSLEQPGLVPAGAWLPDALAIQDKTNISVVLSKLTLCFEVIFCLSGALQWFPAVSLSLAASSSRTWSSGSQMWSMNCAASSTSQVKHCSGCRYLSF